MRKQAGNKGGFNFECSYTDLQKKVLNFYRSNSVSVVTGDPGTGKAQPLTSKVYTPNGYKLMGDIVVGDSVLTLEGVATVTGVFPQGVTDVYKVSFSDGSSSECCGDHLWLTLSSNERKRTHVTRDFECYTVRDTKSMMSNLYRYDKLEYSIPLAALEFSHKTTIIPPYTLGVLLGDGCLRSKVSFSTSDPEIYETVKSEMTRCDVQKIESSKYEYSIITADKSYDTSKGVTSYLKLELMRLNLMYKYSYEKHIPEEYIYNSVETRLSILQGLLDTDGTIDKRTGSVSFSSTSEKLIEGVRSIVTSLGGVCGKPSIKITDSYRDAYSVTITLPNGINPFRLERKKKYVTTKTKYQPVKYITGIELLRNDTTQCIMVDSQSHTYITDGMNTTHNTFMSLYYGLMMLKDNAIEELIISKPLIEVGSKLGFLPGSEQEKVSVYMDSYANTFKKIVGEAQYQYLISAKKIRFEPVNYVRGSSFENALVIMDEAQGLTLHELMTFVTRLSESSQLILLGDLFQADIKNSGFGVFIDHIANGVLGIDHMDLGDEYQMRHPMIVHLYKNYKTYLSTL